VGDRELQVLCYLLRPVWGPPFRTLGDYALERIEQCFGDFAVERFAFVQAFRQHPVCDVIKLWYQTALSRRDQVVSIIEVCLSEIIANTRGRSPMSAVHVIRYRMAIISQYIEPDFRWAIACIAPEVCPVVFGATIFCRAGQTRFELSASVWVEPLGPLCLIRSVEAIVGAPAEYINARWTGAAGQEWVNFWSPRISTAKYVCAAALFADRGRTDLHHC